MFVKNVIVVFGLFLFVESQSNNERKKFSHRFNGDSEKFFKQLEYAANNKNLEGIAEGLSPIDLNLIEENEFAWEIFEGVEEELESFDQPEQVTPRNNQDGRINSGSASLLHKGSYSPSPEWNSKIDELIEKVKREIDKRKLDPIYFTVHKKGVVRHAPKGHVTRDGQLLSEDGAPAVNLRGSQNRTGVLGAGHIGGLLKLRRFGNAEIQHDNYGTLVRSHYFFGPLDVELVFRVRRGLRELNSTLSSLAAHALHRVDNSNNIELLEFILDSPLEYEVELVGTKNKRVRRLSQASILRIFKATGRMRTRLDRIFKRATNKLGDKKTDGQIIHPQARNKQSSTKPVKFVSKSEPRL